MRALTVCQPFASLIISGEKRVENRTMPFNYRGPIVIHAGKSKAWLHKWSGQMPVPMPFGAALGTVEIVDCVELLPAGDEHLVPEAARLTHPWLETDVHTSGPFCLILQNVRVFEQPIPYNGMLGLWDFPNKLLPNGIAS